MEIKLRGNGQKPGMMTRVRAWLLGVEPEAFVGIQTLLNGYKGSQRKGNSMIMGGPTAWQWYATIDDTHHGVRTLANAHAHGHLSGIGANDHHDAFTSGDHDAIGDGAPHHARQHAMDAALDHAAGAEGDLLRAIAAGAWARLAAGINGQLLTMVAGLPAWSDAPAVGVHGNAAHDPDFYPLNGTERLTAPLLMHLMAPGEEPTAVAGNEGKLYYLTPGAGAKGIIKQVMLNSTAAFELVQIAVST